MRAMNGRQSHAVPLSHLWERVPEGRERARPQAGAVLLLLLLLLLLFLPLLLLFRFWGPIKP